jgi:nucleoside-diphosphate-sugar epimerase
MRIAILGATSQIAKDLILSFVHAGQKEELSLFARRPGAVSVWLDTVGLAKHFSVADFAAFGSQDYDAIINFIGVGNPAQAVAMGATIFDITSQFDNLVLDYLHGHPGCRYLFLSSGAAYGSSFNEPVQRASKAMVTLNDLPPQEWYGVAKLHAECRHRGLPHMAIIDIRVFGYFSRTQDLSPRFLLTDIIRNIRDGTVLQTTPDYIVRDFLHPADFSNLIHSLLTSPPVNLAVDCYSRAPVDKPSLLAEMQRQFGLRYEVTEEPVAVNATGAKPHYYSLNHRAADFGYSPTRTSIEGVLEEARAIFMSR